MKLKILCQYCNQPGAASVRHPAGQNYWYLSCDTCGAPLLRMLQPTIIAPAADVRRALLRTYKDAAGVWNLDISGAGDVTVEENLQSLAAGQAPSRRCHICNHSPVNQYCPRCLSPVCPHCYNEVACSACRGIQNG